MSRTTPQMRGIAGRLMAQEGVPTESDTSISSAAFQVCEKLRPHLASLMGATGFHALLCRALLLARVEVPRLSSLEVTADGLLAPRDESTPPLDGEDLAAGGQAIIAHLLSLLEAFVGERLTLRMLHTVCPALQLDE